VSDLLKVFFIVVVVGDVGLECGRVWLMCLWFRSGYDRKVVVMSCA